MGGKASSPACCPPGSLPELNAAAVARGDPRQPRGRQMQLQASGKLFYVYLVTPPEGVMIKGAVVYAHDIFGYCTGRSMLMCDDIAARGYVVAQPDLFETNDLREEKEMVWPPWNIFTKTPTFFTRLRQPWEHFEARLMETIKLLRSEAGPSIRVGAVGACFGGWIVFRAAGMNPVPPIVCGVGWHPSPDIQRLQNSGPTTKEIFEAVKVPMLMMPSWQDLGYLMNESWWLKHLNKPGSPTEGSQSITFSEQLHGWTVRGDITNAKVKRDVDLALNKTVEFFDKHVSATSKL